MLRKAEKAFLEKNSKKIKYLIGVDEAGRGAFFGPVTAAAVAIPVHKTTCDAQWYEQVTDSKILSAEKRKTLNSNIIDAFPSAFSHVSVKYINHYNINEAIKYAAYRSVQAVLKPGRVTVENSMILFDGSYRFRYPALHMTHAMPEIQDIIKGDLVCFSISCASILAKYNRDSLIENAQLRFPDYGLASNKGYGTIKHREAIAACGATRYHRTLYIRNIMKIK